MNTQEAPIITKEQGIAIRWKCRRRMAWVALYSMITVQLLSMFFVAEKTLEALQAAISWFYTTMAAVIGGYIGTATFNEHSERMAKLKEQSKNEEK